MPAKLTTPQDIQTMVGRKKVSFPLGTFKLGKPTVDLEGKLICSSFINGILNTFPSVWDAEFDGFIIRYDTHTYPQLFLKIIILSTGVVEYPLGYASIRLGEDQKNHILRLS